MTTDRALLQQALDALESCDIDFSSDYNQTFNADLVKIAKIAIKARLAQPEQYQTSSPRPYNTLPRSPKFDAFIRAFWRRINAYKNEFDKELPEEMPVQFRASMETALLVFDKEPIGYAHPQPERKPLTEEEIMDLTVGRSNPLGGIYASSVIDFARAIERAHGITDSAT